MKIIIISIFCLLFPPVAFASEVSIAQMSANHCVPGVQNQPNGPFAIYTFCDDALGTNIAVFLSDLGAPLQGKYTLTKRFWQNDEWGADVTSIAWLPDRKHLFISTSAIYGTGKVYLLELESQSYREIYALKKEMCIVELKEIKGKTLKLNIIDCEQKESEIEISI